MAKVKDRYARALFQITKERSLVEEDLEQVIFVRDSLKGEDTQSFLEHPNISNTTKYDLFDKAFSNRVNKHIMGFLYLMVRRNRESFILPALNEYVELANRYFGKTVARVVSAEPLSEEQIKSLAKILSKKTGMEVEIKTEIDPDVIGGFYVLVEGKIFDNTIRASINKTKKQFYKGEVLARVVTATPLSETQIQSITELLTSKLGNKVSVNVVVDPDLIGGFYVVADGNVYDRTIRSGIKDMKNNLKKENREENLNGK